MGGEVGQHPGGRAAALADHRGQLADRPEWQLAASDPGRLQHPEETTRVQIGDRLVREAPELLCPGSALAEHRDQRLRAKSSSKRGGPRAGRFSLGALRSSLG